MFGNVKQKHQQKPLYLGDGRMSHRYVLHFISTIPSVLQVAQQVAFSSVESPKDGCFLPHLHFLLFISTIPFVLQLTQQVAFSSVVNQKDEFLQHLHILLSLQKFLFIL